MIASDAIAERALICAPLRLIPMTLKEWRVLTKQRYFRHGGRRIPGGQEMRL